MISITLINCLSKVITKDRFKYIRVGEKTWD